MIRLLFYGFAIYVFLRLIKRLVFSRGTSPGPGSDVRDGNTDLYKDPQCGTYFLKNRGTRAVLDGREVYFCSPECRDEYLRRRGQRS